MNEKIETKKSNRKWLKPTLITISTLVIVASLTVGSYYLFFKPSELTPAPDFFVTDLDGSDFVLSEQNDTVVLIDFMSTTCIPCRQQMPELVALAEKYQNNLTIVSINIETSESIIQLEDFRNEFNATWSFAFDSDGLIAKYNVLSLPKAVVVDLDGYITFEESALGAKPDFEILIEEALEGNAERTTFTLTAEFGLPFALLAGFVSFFTPCAFPLLPGYVGVNLKILAKEDESKNDTKELSIEEEIKPSIRSRVWKSVKLGLAAAGGIALFYMLIGLITAGIGAAIAPWMIYFMPVMGAIFLILGIILLIPKFQINTRFAQNIIAKLMRKKKQSQKNLLVDEELTEKQRARKLERTQMTTLFLYGIGYALASIGCNGPILVAIISYALSSGGFGLAILTFVIYAIAMAILMVIVTILVGLSKDGLLNVMKRSTKVFNIISAVLLLLVGAFLIGYFIYGYAGFI